MLKESVLRISRIGGNFTAFYKVGSGSFGGFCHRMTPTVVLEGHFGALSLTGSGGTAPVPGDSCNSGCSCEDSFAELTLQTSSRGLAGGDAGE